MPSRNARREPDGQGVRASVGFFFTINGKELRPEGGGTFQCTFDGPAGSYPSCVVH